MATCRDCFFALSIAALFGAGTLIALHSGLALGAPRRFVRLCGDLSRLGVALIASGVLLAMIQDWMGYKMGFSP